MSASVQSARPALELLDTCPAVDVQEFEYRRLLGYPKDHAPGDRANELATWARRWYTEHGRPWIYLREVETADVDDTLRVDGVEFQSHQLRRHLREAGAGRAMLVAVSAGRHCEEYAAQLWQESKPDEYFFLEIFGSAVVEDLVARLNGRICDLAEPQGLMAVRHYSPGYSGWDVADQNKLFEVIARGMNRPFPESVEVLPSGMLRPKKSLLAVIGLTARTEQALVAPHIVPCENCSFSPCRYRRAPYRHASVSANGKFTRAVPGLRNVTYTVNPRALRKWAQERVRIAPRGDGSLAAIFRFDGTTCSNLGRALAFDYVVHLGSARDGYTILETECRPATDDEGHKAMCAYLSDGPALMQAIATEKPLLGRPLDDALAWSRPTAPAGCHCDADSRAHKWGLAFEAIHFALANFPAARGASS